MLSVGVLIDVVNVMFYKTDLHEKNEGFEVHADNF
jgi:hypothetical protein